MFTHADLSALILVFEYSSCLSWVVFSKLRRWSIYDVPSITELLQPDLLAPLFVLPFFEAGEQPEKGIAFLLLTFVVVTGTLASHIYLRHKKTLRDLLGSFVIAMMLGIGIFAVVVLLITVMFPTPANIATLPTIPSQLAQLAVNLTPLMMLVVLIPFTRNLLNDWEQQRGI